MHIMYSDHSAVAIAAVVMARRKKHSAQGGVAARTRARTPPNERRLNEIVEEIADHLRPWRDRKDYAEITLAVSRDLNFLLLYAPIEARRSDRTLNRTHAKQLDRALLNVETLLASAPGDLARRLFNPLPPGAKWKDGLLMEALQDLDEDIERQNRERSDLFAAELKRMRAVCALAICPGFGHHPNYDPLKRLCAMWADGLLAGLSRKKITGTKDDAFRAIASLFYEAVSGQHDVDLKRACDFTLRYFRDPKPA